VNATSGGFPSVFSIQSNVGLQCWQCFTNAGVAISTISPLLTTTPDLLRILKMGLGAVRLFFIRFFLTVNVHFCTLLRMQEAVLTYLFVFLIGLGSSWFVCMSFFWRFGRRCTNLEFAVSDLQERLKSTAGREMAKVRWDKDKQFQAEMAQMLQGQPPPRRKYDNDPLGTE
jgi:hypothetical protein